MVTKECDVCGRLMIGVRATQRFCGQPCYRKAENRRKAEQLRDLRESPPDDGMGPMERLSKAELVRRWLDGPRGTSDHRDLADEIEIRLRTTGIIVACGKVLSWDHSDECIRVRATARQRHADRLEAPRPMAVHHCTLGSRAVGLLDDGGEKDWDLAEAS